MTSLQAIELVAERFPFGERYLRHAYLGQVNVAKTVSRYLRPGERVLDFGCGPADKAAVLSLMGFDCVGFDDLSDPWHLEGNNRERILEFAARVGVDFRVAADGYLPFEAETFHMAMLHHVLEHLHDSPRQILNDIMSLIRPGGYLFVTVPNAANLRKRLDIPRGRTNLPLFEAYYWNDGVWRGHVREYVRSDLLQLADYIGLDIRELHTCNDMLNRLPRPVWRLYLAATSLLKDGRDTWTMVGQKPPGWVPNRDAAKHVWGGSNPLQPPVGAGSDSLYREVLTPR